MVSVTDTIAEQGLVLENIPYNTISALANNILDIVLIRDIERDLARPAWWRGRLT